MRTIDGREFDVQLTSQTFAEVIRNLGEAYVDATGSMRDMLDRAACCSRTGSSTPRAATPRFEAKHIVFVGRTSHDFAFERPGLVGRPDPRGGRLLHPGAVPATATSTTRSTARRSRLEGEKLPGTRQETDTISRMVYGMATRLPADRRGPLPRGGRARAPSTSASTSAPSTPARASRTGYHGSTRRAAKEKKILASEFGDDYDAIPAYEQIYALAGPTQTFRVTGDPRIESDIDMTIELFNRFYLDRDGGGYFSHLDPITLRPAQRGARPQPGAQELELRRRPRTRVPDQRLPRDRRSDAHADFLASTATRSATTSPTTRTARSCNERFHEDWSHDHAWSGSTTARSSATT